MSETTTVEPSDQLDPALLSFLTAQGAPITVV
jgi:hypothetical protein